MNESPKSFHPSFNYPFCLHLEYTLTVAFASMSDDRWKHFWCDGILQAPYYHEEDNRTYLSDEQVHQRRNIVTTAWLGMTGQDVYELTLWLGKKALNRYKNEQNLSDCIPDSTVTEWIHLDTSSRTIALYLL